MAIKGLDKVGAAIDEMVERQNTKLKSLYISTLSNIVEETPADEGVARNSWYMTTGSPSDSGARSGDQNGSDSLEDVLAMPKNVIGKTVYFTNNLPYIVPLENGWSKQNRAFAARNMVKLSNRINE